jgi:hypothetical protein
VGYLIRRIGQAAGAKSNIVSSGETPNGETFVMQPKSAIRVLIAAVRLRGF